MGSFQINPSFLKGKIETPPSKSHTLRALLFGLLGSGKSYIHNYLQSPDTEAMVRAIGELGAKVTISQQTIEIEGTGGILTSPKNVINAGNSGIVLRFISAIAAFLPTYTIISGDASIRNNRPMEPLLKGLEQFGAFAVSSKMNGYAPLIIRGPITPSQAYLSGEDSQHVSALLIAASFLKGESEIFVSTPGETPWIDMTLDWLKFLGISIDNTNYERYIIKGENRCPTFKKEIPGDLSSAAYPIAAALITNSELTIGNVDLSDIQGDKKFIDTIIQMGANIEIDSQNKKLIVKKGHHLKGILIDINPLIDMLPLLPVIACFAEGETEIYNGANARNKESDRIATIALELKKMGANIEELETGLRIKPSSLLGAHLKSHNDHRIAMSLAVAAMGAKGNSYIEGIEWIAKTYPSFQKDFNAIGAAIE